MACIPQVMWAYERRRHSSGFERHKRVLWSEDLPTEGAMHTHNKNQNTLTEGSMKDAEFATSGGLVSGDYKNCVS